MMRDVTSDDEGESAHGERFAVRDAVTRPRTGRQILEKANRGQADEAKFLDVIEPRNSVGLGTFRPDILIVTGKRLVESSRKPESAEREDAFRVGDVVEQFANAPFVGGIAVKK